MTFRKLVSFAAAAALIVGMAPMALADNQHNLANLKPKNAKEPYDKGVYVDPIERLSNEINIGEVRVSTAVNYSKDYEPWVRTPHMTDLVYTAHGQAEVPVEVRFAAPKDVEIDMDNIVVSGSVYNGKTYDLTYNLYPTQTFYDPAGYAEMQIYDEDGSGGTSYKLPTYELGPFDDCAVPHAGKAHSNYHTLDDQGRVYQVLVLSTQAVRDAGFRPFCYTIDAGNKFCISYMDGNDVLMIGYELGDPSKRLVKLLLEDAVKNAKTTHPHKAAPGSPEQYFECTSLPANTRYDVPNIWLTEAPELRYSSLTILCPVTTELMTVTLRGKGSDGNYYFGSFTTKAKAQTEYAYISSVAKTGVNGNDYSINGFTKNTVTLATRLSKGTEFAFDMDLVDKDGKKLPDGRYTLTNFKATVDNVGAADVRSTGFVQDGKLTVYVTNPGVSATYKLTGELRDAGGNIKYVFEHQYVITQSGGLYASAFTVAPSPVTIKVGETKDLTVTRVTSDIDVTKATFSSEDTTIASVAGKAGTNMATVTGVKVGSTVVNVTVPGVVSTLPVVVNVLSDQGTFEDTIKNLKKCVVRVNTSLNVRSAPSTSSRSTVIGRLLNGNVVYMDPVESTDQWFWITYKQEVGGKTVIVQGYVSARYLDMSE